MLSKLQFANRAIRPLLPLPAISVMSRQWIPSRISVEPEWTTIPPTAGAVSRFAAAPDEQWLGLIAAMEHGDQPARAALAHMLTWALRQDEGALAGESCACSTENCDDP